MTVRLNLSDKLPDACAHRCQNLLDTKCYEAQLPFSEWLCLLAVFSDFYLPFFHLTPTMRGYLKLLGSYLVPEN